MKSVDRTIISLAVGQHGIVARWQLLALGISPDAIDRRIANGLLRPVHRGVYQVGPVAGRWATEMAAVLACGGRAWVSHGSRGVMAQLLPPACGAPVDVVVQGNGGRVRGVRAHRTTLTADDVTVADGVPVVRLERTLVDLARMLDPDELERILAMAERQRLINRPRLLAAMERCRGHVGSRRIRRLLRGTNGPAYTRSPLERRLLKLIRDAGLPEPLANALLLGFEVDLYWPDAGLVVEADGFRFHSLRRDFERDRLRDQVLAAAGLRVIRITERQLTDDPRRVLETLRRALQVQFAIPHR
ncbi:MAG TPA: type IV toxin-antitoxin system AbiEi family antitoxin domain-containing protein [Longimicrobiales bacterium]|nr:type IV toxin-antitoxin system AbiEi family antitoxin domain-containing protein [Longimicrobiales bacterium]